MILSFTNCEEAGIKNPPDPSSQGLDTTRPVILLNGRKNDTTYLKIVNLDLTLKNIESTPKWSPPEEGDEYYDPGVVASDDKDGDISLFLEISGRVNKRIRGTYFLTYNAKDAAGNIAITETRTVHVIENSAHFLNGTYNVACTCTSTADRTSTVTTSHYTATIATSEGVNGRFALSALNIGPDYRVLSPSLKGSKIIDDPYSYINPVEYHPDNSFSGVVSATKDAFIIETAVLKWTPSVAYKCKNIYTKIKSAD